MDQGLIIYEITSYLFIPVAATLIKMYGDLRSYKTKIESIQLELAETKTELKNEIKVVVSDCKESDDRMMLNIDKRFDKMELLIEKLFTYQRENT